MTTFNSHFFSPAKEKTMNEQESLLKNHLDDDSIGLTEISVEEKEIAAAGLFPQKTHPSMNFWESPTLDELAITQNVRPMADIRALFGTWPGEENDGFEADIDELRHQSVPGNIAS